MKLAYSKIRSGLSDHKDGILLKDLVLGLFFLPCVMPITRLNVRKKYFIEFDKDQTSFKFFDVLLSSTICLVNI